MTTTTTRSAPPTPPREPARRRRRPVGIAHYLFVLPALALFTVMIALPAFVGVFFSLTNSIGFGEWDFVGLLNYQALFSDPAILRSYLFTLGFAAVTVVVVNVVAFLLAVGLTARIRMKTGLRAVFVIPMVVSGIIIAYVFNYLFSNSLPQLGQAWGLEWLSSSILANPDLAWVSIVIVTAWQAVPGTLLIYIAGLLAIPGDVYEAADIDGATRGQQMLRITLPLMVGYVVINVILGFKNFLNAYDIIVGLTNGGPGTATRSVAMTIFTGFSGGDYAYQMANATIFFLIVLTLSALQLRLTRGRKAL
ncbi:MULTISPECIES: carbohydrate ABC transporter permease [unclassified Isoptericola]|uniref:carbohydrate ABC transporter permease n=1 Tax=unclassified Isoptericola TaxID=2623355 RepID=UPI002712EA4C|nr:MULTISPECIES: sugar ABC transporter permease [unclassified Isoptericola]MDO8148924.1 sugar ABC transporter permease [Isoptericola sp. b515]MDO8151133.1 sugar ABC transporter permease [Isoptericola sp. b408]